jgi:hypothetical protein
VARDCSERFLSSSVCSRRLSFAEDRQSHNLESDVRLTHFGFLLKVEFIDLLQFTFQSEEEGSFVGLQGSLRIWESGAIGEWLLGREDRRFAQVLDELWKCQ